MIKLKLVLITLIIFALFSCKKETTTQKNSSNDSILNVVDKKSIHNSKKNDNKTIPVQLVKNCDQTFEEFFERFSKDSIYQKSRVKYPLNFLYNDYEIDSIIVVKKFNSKNEYKYIDFTDDKNAMKKKSEKYTVDIEKKSDSIIKYRHLGYDNGIMDTYTFKQIDGCWYMVEILDEST